MKFTLKKFKQEYYCNLVERFLSNVDFYKVTETINHDSENLGILPTEDNTPKRDGIVRVYKDGNTYAIYCDSVRIIFVRNGKENLMQVSLLGNEENWTVLTNDSKGKTVIDITSAETKVYTVYTACDTIIPTGRLVNDERYTSGTWNEYVYNSVTTMIGYVLDFNETNKYNKLYDKNVKKDESTSY
jgi:hypothetical protein